MLELRPVRRNLVYDPFRAMDDFERRFFGEPSGFHPTSGGIFSTDIRDAGDSYVLEADLPGFQKENINIDLNGDVLTVSAERHSEKEDKDAEGKFLRCERSYGTYQRQFDVSEVDVSGIAAKYENGVLTLTLPKKAAVLPEAKHVTIE